MKIVNYLMGFFILFFASINAQSIFQLPEQDGNKLKSYPVDGTHLLEKKNQEVYEYFRNNPDALNRQSLNKVNWNFSVGTTRNFYAYNFVADSRYSTSFTCRAVGNNCYIFVEDSLWGSRVNQTGVDSVLKAFDERTPANPSKGIYQMDVTAFGNPPNVDDDPRIIILILNILDGYNGNGGFIAGYFDPYNELLNYSTSNKAEVYYLDANPINLTTVGGIQLGMSTAAHEFQHMINFNYHSSGGQTTFINESCSMLAELYCGYPTYNLSLYGNETNYYLLGWRDDNTLVLNDYSRAQRFALYLWDQFGINIFKYIVQSTSYDGIPLYNYALQQIGSTKTFDDVFNDWLIANYLNDTTVSRTYGYDYPGLYKSHATTYYNPNTSGGNTLDNLGAEYITFTGGENLSITFTTSSVAIAVKAIKIGSGGNQVVNVPLNSTFTVPDLGSTYSSVTFVIINTSYNLDQSYTFTSSGNVQYSSQELKWDTTEPTGYYVWTPNDTVAVAFDAFPGGKLDSIKVALRRAGSITGGVWEFTGNVQPTPLGKPLAVPIAASITTETTVPYPVPYKNWATVDLTSQTISTDKNFVVGFVIGHVPNTPGVMVTDFPNVGHYHSFTYLQTPDGVTTPNWYYITSGEDTVAIYLIRAYASIITSTGKETIELTPSDFTLSQNYPNPFNPSTSINYHIAEKSLVTLKVYDLLGNEVATIINEEKPAGSYNIQFSTSNLHLSSGTYFYRLQAGNFAETKKMILLK